MLFALVLSPKSSAQITIPENVQLDVYGYVWVCSRGYRKSGNKCISVVNPENAQVEVYGSGWAAGMDIKR